MHSENGEVGPAQLGLINPVLTFRKSDYPWIIAMGVVSATRALGGAYEQLDTKNILPEPFDVPDHIGNTAVSFILLTRFANMYWGKDLQPATLEKYEHKRKMFAGYMGGLAVAANLFAETVGYGQISTPDPIDFVYGCAATFLAYKAKKPSFVPPTFIERIRQSEDEKDEKLKSYLDKLLPSQAEKRPIEQKSIKQTPVPDIKRPGNAQNHTNRHKSRRKIQKQSRKKNRS